MPIERVAVVGGTGDEGFGLACRWAKAGIEIVVGSRDKGRADEAAQNLKALVAGARVQGLENSDAVAASDIVCVTVPFAGQAAIYKSLAEHFRDGALVIDCTVPVAAAVGGKATQVLGVWDGSAAEQAKALLPKGIRLCAAFHSLAAAALNELDTSLEGDVLVCGAKDGKERVRLLVEAIPNLRFVDAGPLSNARLVEPLTALLVGINHRYGIDRAGIEITGLPPDA
ncbi:MAG TPA: NADPH-dependent F420 reductase [Actinomycetota bacterium]|nr:NADPH-dependent F420 reductase [Actinomycetota bacterium]